MERPDDSKFYPSIVRRLCGDTFKGRQAGYRCNAQQLVGTALIFAMKRLTIGLPMAEA